MILQFLKDHNRTNRKSAKLLNIDLGYIYNVYIPVFYNLIIHHVITVPTVYYIGLEDFSFLRLYVVYIYKCITYIVLIPLASLVIILASNLPTFFFHMAFCQMIQSLRK